MGSFSMWHWLVVLLVIAIPASTIWLVIRVGRNDRGNGGVSDITVLTKWVIWLLYTTIASAAIALISDAVERQLLDDFASGIYTSRVAAVAAGEASDTRQRIIGVIQFVLYVSTAILFLTWIYRANASARQLGAVGMRYTPGWCVGWYFVPIANLWKPFGAMRELWRASSGAMNWQAESTPAQLGWWWFFWIAGNIRLSLPASDLGSALAVNTANFVSDILSIPGCLLLAWIIKNIQARQMARRQVEAGVAA